MSYQSEVNAMVRREIGDDAVWALFLTLICQNHVIFCSVGHERRGFARSNRAVKLLEIVVRAILQKLMKQSLQDLRALEDRN